MIRTLFLALLLLLASAALTLGVEHFDKIRQQNKLMDQIQNQLPVYAQRLQARLDAFVYLAESLARQLTSDGHRSDQYFQELAQAAAQREPRVRSVVISRKLRAAAVYPIRGNEPVVGIDFSLYPQFIAAIDRAVTKGLTVVDAPHRLLQSGKQGLIVRTPVFSPTGEFSMMVSAAVDIEPLLIETGLLEPALNFTPLIVQRTPEQADRRVFGSSDPSENYPGPVRIVLPDGEWLLYAEPKVAYADYAIRAHWIRGVGATLAIGLLIVLMWRGGVLGGIDKAVVARGLSIRTLMLLAVLIPSTLLAAVAGWFSYRSSMQVAQRMEWQQVDELARQIHEQVNEFFQVPRTVDRLMAELFRQGVLNPDRSQDIVTALLAQLRQQPFLTLLSFGNRHGEYFGAGRPPLCDDKTVHVLSSTLSDDRLIKVYRVDVSNRRSSLESTSPAPFDARDRSWYRAAVQADRLVWYDAYRYAAGHADECFDAVGFGMSAPVYTPDQHFAGVITADISLTQLSHFLTVQASRVGASALITREDGTLLASSIGAPVYRLDAGKIIWIRADQSDSSLVRAVGAAIQGKRTDTGNALIENEDGRFLLSWSSLRLPDGPVFKIAISLPRNRSLDSTQTVVRDAVYLGAVVVGIGLLLALFFTYWLTQPLRMLDKWARRLKAGQRVAAPPIRTGVKELASLTAALESMAEQQHRHAEELEQKVIERTESLAQANRKLAELSMTDELTGIANRRHFDRTAELEFARVSRTGQAMALILLDVDYFKVYNDDHGHLAGDEALQRIAAVLRSYTRREGDLAARYGGEEFGIILPAVTAQDALELAERMRAEIQALALPNERSPHFVVTASVGIAMKTPHGPLSVVELIAQADTALYQAKNQGRNCVRLANTPS